MARIQMGSGGPSTGYPRLTFAGNCDAEINGGVTSKVSLGRLRGGMAASISKMDSGDSAVYSWTLSPFTDTIYLRCYVRVRGEYPSAGGSTFLGVKNSIEGSDAGCFYIESDGTIYGISQGNAGSSTEMGHTTAGLTLGQWHRVNIQVNMDSRVALTIDGAAYPADDTDGPTGFVATSGGRLSGVTTGFGYATATVSQLGIHKVAGTFHPMNGGQIDITDLVVDGASDPDAGAVSLLHISGQGTYAEWTDGAAWERVIRAQPEVDGTAAPTALLNTILDAKTSFTVEPFTNRMPAGATIKSIRVCARGGMPRADWKWLLRKSAADTESPLQAAQGTNAQWKGISGLTNGWDPDIALTPADSIEIGLIDGPSGAGTATLTIMCLVVDWEGADPTYSSENEDIEIATGTYVGNATQQDVSVGFKATFLVVKPISANNRGAIWHRGMGEDGEWSMHGQNNGANVACFQRVYATGFTVKGASGSNPGINDSGVTYGWIAVKDNAQRMIATTSRCINPGANALDDYDWDLPDSGFIPEAAILSGQRVITSGSNRIVYRGPDHAGDSSTALDTVNAAAADYIQSMGTGTIQLGSGSVGNLSPDDRHALAVFRTTEFTQETLLVMGRYTGDGSGSRVIPFTVIADPALLIVVPTNTAARVYRFYNDGQGTTSRYWNSSSSDTTSITAFATPNEFTVDSALNANAVDYDFIVFGSGTDLAVLSEIAVPREGFIGLTWVEFFDATDAVHVWGKVVLPDPDNYYHGFKDDRIEKWGSIRRGLSDRLGHYDSATFSWTANDKDRAIRALLAHPETKFFPGAPVTVRMIDDPSRRQLLTPRTMFKGVVDGYKPLADLFFDFRAIDPISKRFSLQDGLTLPQQRVDLADFPQADDKLLHQSAGTDSTIGAVGRGVPIIYGEMSDEDLVTFVIPIARPDVDSDPDFKQPAQHANDISGAGTLDGWILGYVLPYDSGTNTLGRIIALSAGTFDNDRAVSFRWETGHARTTAYWLFAADAGDFNPFGSKGSATFVRRKIHNLVEDHPGTDRPFQEIFTGPADGDDWIDISLGTTTVIEDRGKGQVKPIYVGDYTIGGVVYKGALICGHAVKRLVAGYMNDKRVDLSTDTDWLTPNRAAAWAAAGFTTSYTDINGRRYTIVYLTGTPGEILAGTVAPAAGSPGIMFNVDGVEDVGDGTGALITDGLDQYKHFMKNFVLASYQGGDWPAAAPVFDDDAELAMIDEASFDAAKMTATTRLSGGYPGAWIIGANGERRVVRDVLARLNTSFDVDCYFNRKTQFAVSMEAENIASINDATILDDTLDIFARTFSVEDRLNEHYNVMPFFYAHDYSAHAPDGWSSKGEYSDASSIENYRQTKRSPDIFLWCVRDQAVAEDVAQRRLRRTKNPPRYVRWTVGLQGLNHEIGDIVRLTHHEGVGAAGWSTNPVRITRHEVDPDEYTVTIEGYDLSLLFTTAFILGDRDVLPNLWTAASVLQRQYGYLADRATGLFSDDANGKRLI